MTQQEIITAIVRALDSKRAEDIQVLEIKDLTIIANGTSSTQTKSLADEVEYKLKEQGIVPERTEGYQGANWIILDYADIVVHVFYKETRNFYNLERLWKDAVSHDVSEYIGKQDD